MSRRTRKIAQARRGLSPRDLRRIFRRRLKELREMQSNPNPAIQIEAQFAEAWLWPQYACLVAGLEWMEAGRRVFRARARAAEKSLTARETCS